MATQKGYTPMTKAMYIKALVGSLVAALAIFVTDQALTILPLDLPGWMAGVTIAAPLVGSAVGGFLLSWVKGRGVAAGCIALAIGSLLAAVFLTTDPLGRIGLLLLTGALLAPVEGVVRAGLETFRRQQVSDIFQSGVMVLGGGVRFPFLAVVSVIDPFLALAIGLAIGGVLILLVPNPGSRTAEVRSRTSTGKPRRDIVLMASLFNVGGALTHGALDSGLSQNPALARGAGLAFVATAIIVPIFGKFIAALRARRHYVMPIMLPVLTGAAGWVGMTYATLTQASVTMQVVAYGMIFTASVCGVVATIRFCRDDAGATIRYISMRKIAIAVGLLAGTTAFREAGPMGYVIIGLVATAVSLVIGVMAARKLRDPYST